MRNSHQIEERATTQPEGSNGQHDLPSARKASTTVSSPNNSSIELQKQLLLEYLSSGALHVKDLLDRYPDAITAISELRISPLFSNKISTITLRALIDAMKAKNLSFNESEAWLVRAVEGRGEIDPRDFTALHYNDREKILVTLRHHRFKEFEERLRDIDTRFQKFVSNVIKRFRKIQRKRDYDRYALYNPIDVRSKRIGLPTTPLEKESLFRECLLTRDYPAAQWERFNMRILRDIFHIPDWRQEEWLLSLIKDREPIDLDSFFTSWPSAIHSGRQLSPAFLIDKECGLRSLERIKRLVIEMRVQGIEPPFRVAIALEDRTNFEDADFLSLSPKDKKAIYLAANKLHARRLIRRLNALGMKPPRANPHPFFPMLHPQMDLLDIEEALTIYLQQLRKNGLLFKGSEFKASKKYRLEQSRHLDEFLGVDHLNKIIERLECKSVFVLKRVAVIKGDSSELTLNLGDDFRYLLHSPHERDSIDSYPVQIFFEKVKKEKTCFGPIRIAEKKSFMKLEQVAELAQVLWESGFKSLYNIRRSESGFYFGEANFNDFHHHPSEMSPDLIKRWVGQFVRAEEQQELERLLEPIFEQRPIWPIATYQDPHCPLLHFIQTATISTSSIFNTDTYVTLASLLLNHLAPQTSLATSSSG